MDTPTPSVQPTPQPQQQTPPKSHKARSFVLFLLAVAVLGAFGWLAYRTLTQPAPAVDEEVDVESPDLTSMAQVADYTGDKPLPEPDTTIDVLPPQEGDHIYGVRTATLSVIEYSNFGNQYSTLFHPELKRIVDESNGGIHWIFRHYPLSEAEFVPAEAAECAGRQQGENGFWTYFDLSFGQKNLSRDLMVSLAEAIGVDTTTFEECLNDRLARSRVVSQAQGAALDAGVTVSPTYILRNNATGEVRVASGLNTTEYVMAALDAMR